VLTEQEQRQMNEEIGELLAALGTTLRVLDDLSYEVNRRFYMQEAEEVHQKIGQSHRDRQSKFREYLLADSRRTALLKSANWLRFQASDHTMTDAESIELCKLASELTGMANGETAS
jgi:hypothetical protein